MTSLPDTHADSHRPLQHPLRIKEDDSNHDNNGDNNDANSRHSPTEMMIRYENTYPDDDDDDQHRGSDNANHVISPLRGSFHDSSPFVASSSPNAEEEEENTGDEIMLENDNNNNQNTIPLPNVETVNLVSDDDDDGDDNYDEHSGEESNGPVAVVKKDNNGQGEIAKNNDPHIQRIDPPSSATATTETRPNSILPPQEEENELDRRNTLRDSALYERGLDPPGDCINDNVAYDDDGDDDNDDDNDNDLQESTNAKISHHYHRPNNNYDMKKHAKEDTTSYDVESSGELYEVTLHKAAVPHESTTRSININDNNDDSQRNNLLIRCRNTVMTDTDVKAALASFGTLVVLLIIILLASWETK